MTRNNFSDSDKEPDDRPPRNTFWDHVFISAGAGIITLLAGVVLVDSLLHGSANEVRLAVQTAVALTVLSAGAILFYWLRKHYSGKP